MYFSEGKAPTVGSTEWVVIQSTLLGVMFYLVVAPLWWCSGSYTRTGVFLFSIASCESIEEVHIVVSHGIPITVPSKARTCIPYTFFGCWLVILIDQ